ncbi:hypothetical protein LO772_29810 [Yinghuangia sp. ASG 101]|uniref:hypothetical protein n=1 Tax=Yinghuangia sp. ASG 101 TaxID=2896848 RepID=UPI001E3BF9C2|nr:hypothetical protein [Yinghuangia sp. ASG 101]UGQ10963.1 hypothetical protein LO772_29810 [Yinghuangia sp. ASG 101]
MRNNDSNHPAPSEEPSPNSHPLPVPEAYDPSTGAQLAEQPGLLHTHDGELVICTTCGAERDWLLITYNGSTWVRCRCGREWLPSTPVDTDSTNDQRPNRYWPTLDAAITSLGFDGAFKGIYLN